MVDAPAQIVVVPAIEAVGIAFTVNVAEAVPVQPLALVAVTENVPAVETVIAAAVAALDHI